MQCWNLLNAKLQDLQHLTPRSFNHFWSHVPILTADWHTSAILRRLPGRYWLCHRWCYWVRAQGAPVFRVMGRAKFPVLKKGETLDRDRELVHRNKSWDFKSIISINTWYWQDITIVQTTLLLYVVICWPIILKKNINKRSRTSYMFLFFANWVIVICNAQFHPLTSNLSSELVTFNEMVSCLGCSNRAILFGVAYMMC